jgi:hypothetical protein
MSEQKLTEQDATRRGGRLREGSPTAEAEFDALFESARRHATGSGYRWLRSCIA